MPWRDRLAVTPAARARTRRPSQHRPKFVPRTCGGRSRRGRRRRAMPRRARRVLCTQAKETATAPRGLAPLRHPMVYSLPHRLLCAVRSVILEQNREAPIRVSCAASGSATKVPSRSHAGGASTPRFGTPRCYCPRQYNNARRMTLEVPRAAGSGRVPRPLRQFGGGRMALHPIEGGLGYA
jgi:hypothetical protein